MSDEKYILCVGLVCLDILAYSDHFPEEDSDQRCQSIRWNRGGNASNSSTVLSLLGAATECIATLADSPELSFLTSSFAFYGIKINNCVHVKECSTPTAVCIINGKNGSRTLLYSNKNLPELSYEHFEKLDLKKYKWIHFEGRPNVEEICKMMHHVDQYNTTAAPQDQIITSVELEKPRKELEQLTDKSDYVFVGKEHARFCGYTNKETAVDAMIRKCRPGATLIIAWGEDGAIAMTKEGHIHKSPIFSPDQVVDTLGAGDTFNAAVMYSLSKKMSIDHAIKFGCQVAGEKCGFQGFDKLRGFIQNPKNMQCADV